MFVLLNTLVTISFPPMHPQAMPRLRKSTSTSNLLTTDNATEALVNLVRSIPQLYNVTHPDHKDSILQSNAWTSIAEALEMPGVTGKCWHFVHNQSVSTVPQHNTEVI